MPQSPSAPSEIRRCPTCSKEYPSTARVCPADGAFLEGVGSEGDRNKEVLGGKYRIDDYITEGGMGAVYRATHLMLDKQVAVKLIKPEFTQKGDALRRFQREARTASHLHHPNIVGVHDLGLSDDGTVYIAMELVDGLSVKQVIQAEGALAPERSARLVRQVCAALNLAHDKGIIHRDLKPHNIMIAKDADGHEIAKLLDFGIAKSYDVDSSTALTTTGMVMGTPQYMSPEQARAGTIDGRSDIYSLGIVLYEMLAGKVPFLDPSVAVMLHKHMFEAPPSLSERAGVPLPRGLEEIVARCLEKEPEKRFQTARELQLSLMPWDPDAQEQMMSATTGKVGAAGGAAVGGAAAAAVAAAHHGATDVVEDETALSDDATDATLALGAGGMATAVADEPGTVALEGTGLDSATPRPLARVGSTAAAASSDTLNEAIVVDAQPTMIQGKTANKTGRSLAMVGVVALVAVAAGAFALIGGRGSDPPPPAVEGTTSGVRNLAASAAVPAVAVMADAASADAAPVEPAAAMPASGEPAAGEPASGEPVEPPLPTAGDGHGAGAPVPPSAQPPSAARGSELAPAEAPVAATARREEPHSDASAPSAAPAVRMAANRGARPEVRREVAPAPARPAAPVLPEVPSVHVSCGGPAAVCGVLRTTFARRLAASGLRVARSSGDADIDVMVEADLLDETTNSNFGQTMTTRTFSLAASAESPTLGAFVPMPEPETVSFAMPHGRQRLNERARLLADASIEHIQKFWKQQR